MNNRLTDRERKHLGAVKSLPCSVCDAPGPSEAHHVQQGRQFTAISLCVDCHRSPLLGWHGQKRAWAVRRMSELDALDVTIRRLMEVR